MIYVTMIANQPCITEEEEARPYEKTKIILGYIRQVHEHVFPTFRYLHLSTKAKR